MPPSMARPTVPGFAERFLGRVPHRNSGFGRAEIFVHHRSPPVDHRALELRRAGRGTMNDEAQRRQVVTAAYLLRQPQQPHEHGRHHVHMGDAVARDQLQHVLGVEAGLEHDLTAVAERQHAVGIRRRMVHRAVHQDDLILPRLDAIGDAADARRGRDLFGPHRLAAHALGQACGARGVEHRCAADRRLRRRCVGVTPAVPVRCALGDLRQIGRDVERRGDFRRRLDHQQAEMVGQAARDLRQQVGVADQNVGAAVGQDIGDLLGFQMPVDRHHRAAQRRGGAGDLEQREIIAQHHGDGRAAAQAERPQSRRRPGDAGVNSRDS